MLSTTVPLQLNCIMPGGTKRSLSDHNSDHRTYAPKNGIFTVYDARVVRRDSAAGILKTRADSHLIAGEQIAKVSEILRSHHGLRHDVHMLRPQMIEQRITVLKSIPAIANATTQEKLAGLEPLHGQFSVHVLCEALDVPRETFYNHISRNKRDNSSYAKHREDLRTAIQELFEESRQTFGSEKICAVLHERGYKAGTTLVRELVSEMGLSSVSTTSKRQWKKSNSYERKANILQRQFHAEAPNCVWVSDVTCMKLKDRYDYLYAIVDLYSRKVIAHKVSTRNSTQLITATLKMAYNAVAETFFATFKKEEAYRREYTSEQSFRKSVEQYIQFYNEVRPHQTLKYKTPQAVEEKYWTQFIENTCSNSAMK